LQSLIVSENSNDFNTNEKLKVTHKRTDQFFYFFMIGFRAEEEWICSFAHLFIDLFAA
jgi:hypothetical protein